RLEGGDAFERGGGIQYLRDAEVQLAARLLPDERLLQGVEQRIIACRRKSRRVRDVYVRIHDARCQKFAAPVDALCIRRRFYWFHANRSDAFTTDKDVAMRQRLFEIRRN